MNLLFLTKSFKTFDPCFSKKWQKPSKTVIFSTKTRKSQELVTTKIEFFGVFWCFSHEMPLFFKKGMAFSLRKWAWLLN
jgi:hypothetical protein